MSAKPQHVKARQYDASGRQRRADERRDAALGAAQDLFLVGGYAATTVEAIAQASGTSAATIYKSYGGKAGLARELCRRALDGAGPVPAETRSDALRTGDASSMITGWARLIAEVAPRVAPLLLVLRAAAEADQEVAALYAELDAARLARMADNAKALARGGLAAGVTVADARDVLWTCSSPELYDLLVVRRGWPVRKFSDFVTRTFMHALLG